MIVKEIPRHRWPSFLEELSLAHEGWLVMVERVGAGADDERSSEQAEYPMEAVRFEFDEDGTFLQIECEDRAPIFVDAPARIAISRTDEFADELVEIESERGTLELHLRFPRKFLADESNSDFGLPSEEVGLEPASTTPIEDRLRIKSGL